MGVDVRGRHYLSTADFSAAETLEVLRLARELKSGRRGGAEPPRLAGKTLAMIFQKPSLRTRVSFEAGMTQLGGHAIYLAPADIRLGERETLEDVALTLARMADLVMARVFGHDVVAGLARHSCVPVINGLSDREHPCQILADLMTVLERRGRLDGLKAVFSGDGNNVAHSLLLGSALVGMSLTVVTPPGFEPDAGIVAQAQRLGSRTGAAIAVSHDLPGAAKGADVIYTDVWASMGQEAESAARREKFRDYQVNSALLKAAGPDAVLLHCLPAHYGEEIEYEASRSPHSAIFDQAENRLHAQKALMVMLAG